jgi:tetratricopeptide (TPR) repeat protein
VPLSPERLPTLLKLALYRLVRVRAPHRPGDPGLDPAKAGWRATLASAIALREAGRFAEADSLLARGLAAFPDDPGLLIEHARAADGAGRHREAIPRWQAALTAAPGESICHFSLAADFREIGESVEARRVIEAALMRFPRDSSVICEAGRIAEAEGRFADAAALFGRLVRRRHPHPDWLRGHAHALVLLGRFDEAERTIADALARHPDERMLLAVQGILASSREDWPNATALWAEYRRRFPDDKTGWEHHGRAVQGALLAAEDAGAPVAPAVLSAPLKLDVVEDEDTRALMLGFESIGDSCEFGSVQRRYGAEPLGLLRWNDVQLDDLVAALAHRFEGMGLPEHTEMPVIGNGEYTIRDKRWSLWMHTFLFEGQTDPAALYPKMCRRVAYLRDKLVQDLEAAEKIFVYRSAGIDEARLAAMHEALEAYGRIRLLAVQPASVPGLRHGAPGQIVAVGERCWMGFLSRLGVADGNYWDIAFDEWVSICRLTSAAARSPALPPGS